MVVVVQSLRRVQLLQPHGLKYARNGFKIVRVSASPELGKVRTGTMIRMVPCIFARHEKRNYISQTEGGNVLGSGIVVSEG